VLSKLLKAHNMTTLAAVGHAPTLVYETYVCSCADGMVEWGYCFKQAGSDDIEFDLVIDKNTADIATDTKIQTDYARLEWAAKAVVAASALQQANGGGQ